MGLYLFVVMFPLLAVSGGEPPVGAIAGWGAAAIVLGIATIASPAVTANPATRRALRTPHAV